MAEAAGGASPEKPPVDARMFLLTFAIIFAVIGALWTADTVLARWETEETTAGARRLALEAARLRDVGRNDEAVERLRSAASMDRRNDRYLLALGEALLAVGKLPEAEATLGRLLDRDGTSGPGNLALARVYLAEGRAPAAVGYYHRAIYGHWRPGSGDPVEVRFELAGILARQRNERDLLAELLPLEDLAPRDLATRSRLGSLFFSAGEFRRARASYLEALRSAPADSAARARLAVVDRVLELEPAPRGASATDRTRRARELLRLTVDAVDRCDRSRSDSAAVATDLERARAILRASSSRPEPSADAELQLVQRLWQSDRGRCGPPFTPTEEALATVIARLGR